MKKFITLCITILCFVLSQAQDFDQYFTNKTLRINYLHIGDSRTESMRVCEFHAGGIWSGTHKYLIEPDRYGDILFQVFDSISGQLIYSRSYSCLFGEFRTTERATTESGSFEECITLPFPKNSIRFVFTSYNRRQEGTEICSGYFNHNSTPTIPFVKEYKTMNLHIGGKSENCLDILFIPDGYAKQDEAKLKKDMKAFARHIIHCSPYKNHLSEVNIRAIVGFSEESGITDPNAGVRRSTLLNSSYNVIDVDRYLMCLNVWKMNDIADDAPYDAIIIIANSPKYGGGGIYNFYATVCNGAPQADYVIVHEMGHSIAGLADEYYTSEVSVSDFYPTDIEPIEPNVTTLVNFDLKWKQMLAPKTPVPTPSTTEYDTTLGVFEGGGYVAEGVYRPWRHCTMKEIRYDNFCPVCTWAIEKAIQYYSGK